MYYRPIAGNPARCAHVVPLTQLAADERAHALPALHLDHPQPLPRHARLHARDRRPLPVAARAAAARRARARAALLFLTWDEGTSDDGCCRLASGGHVVTIVAGRRRAAAARGCATPADHYSVLQTIEDLFGLPRLRGAACACTPSLQPLLAVSRRANGYALAPRRRAGLRYAAGCVRVLDGVAATARRWPSGSRALADRRARLPSAAEPGALRPATTPAAFSTCCPPARPASTTSLQLGAFRRSGTIPPHFNDQLPLYQNLVYADPTLTDAQVPQLLQGRDLRRQAERRGLDREPDAGPDDRPRQVRRPAHLRPDPRRADVRRRLRGRRGPAVPDGRAAPHRRGAAGLVRRRLAVQPRDGRDAVGRSRPTPRRTSSRRSTTRRSSYGAAGRPARQRRRRTTSPGINAYIAKARTRSTPRRCCRASTPRSASCRSPGSRPT